MAGAWAVQHEVDHLNGCLICDRRSRLLRHGTDGDARQAVGRVDSGRGGTGEGDADLAALPFRFDTRPSFEE